jgi:hypothetical protein
MPKRSRDRRTNQLAGGHQIWLSRGRSASYQLREATNRSVGSAYDRDPCPHSLITWDAIPDPARPDDPSRARARRTQSRCERPAGHVREFRMVPVDKAGTTVAVPDEAARLHSDAAGRTW